MNPQIPGEALEKPGDCESEVICCDDRDCADDSPELAQQDTHCKSDDNSLLSDATTCCGSEERCDGESTFCELLLMTNVV